MRLGAHERTVLEAMRRAPDMLPDYFGARPGARARIRSRILMARDRQLFDAGEVVPTCYLRWWLPNVHRSTFSRTLATLERKGLVCRLEFEGAVIEDGIGSNTKFLALSYGYRKLLTLTNGRAEC